MTVIQLSRTIGAPLPRVWSYLATLERHVEWMADAERITFLGDRRSGVGTRLRVDTRVGPLRTSDVLEVVVWEPPHRLAVVHRGLVTGTGVFLLEPAGPAATRFTWTEELRFPARLGWSLGARLAAPLLASVWRRNLRRLAERLDG